MSDRHYYIDPATPTDIQGPYFIGREVRLRDGTQWLDNLRGAIPDSLQMYLEQGDASAPLPTCPLDGQPGLSIYYTRRETRTLVGAIDDPAARVSVVVNCDQIPIADLYELKQQEIAAYDAEVRFNAVDTALATNWWVVLTETVRVTIYSTDAAAQWRRFESQAWPSGPNTPNVMVYNSANGRIRREAVPTEAAWITIITEVGQHDQATDNATKASSDALDAAYDGGAGSWEDVANHDAEDPAWGYPPVVNFSQQARIIFGA